jgi:hypothetical protein
VTLNAQIKYARIIGMKRKKQKATECIGTIQSSSKGMAGKRERLTCTPSFLAAERVLRETWLRVTTEYGLHIPFVTSSPFTKDGGSAAHARYYERRCLEDGWQKPGAKQTLPRE